MPGLQSALRRPDQRRYDGIGFQILKLLRRCRDKPFRYSRPLHEHRVVSLRQQVEHSLQISDQVRMQAYRQNARLAFYFAVEYRYRVSQPLKHLR